MRARTLGSKNMLPVLLTALLSFSACGQLLGLEDTELGWQAADASVDHRGGGNANGGTAGNAEGSGGFDPSGGTGGSGGATETCPAATENPLCYTCMNRKCATNCAEYATSEDVLEFSQCFQGCKDEACRSGCMEAYPETSEAFTKLRSCLHEHCATECDGGKCGVSLVDATQDACMKKECLQECAILTADENVNKLISCINPCEDQKCMDTCYATYPQAANDMQTLLTCVASKCGDPDTCGLQTSLDACNVCIKDKCLTECNACATNMECVAIVKCRGDCGSDQGCLDECRSTHHDGISDYDAFLPKDGCLGLECAKECPQ